MNLGATKLGVGPLRARRGAQRRAQNLETRTGQLGDRSEPLPMFLEIGAIARAG